MPGSAAAAGTMTAPAQRPGREQPHSMALCSSA